MHYKTIVLNSRPLTDIEPDTFRTETRPRSELKPGKGEALVQCTWLSLDPAMRGYIRDTRSYLPPVKIGEVCHCYVHGFGGICAEGAYITAGDACCWPWCGCGSGTREHVWSGWSCCRFMGCVPYFACTISMYPWISGMTEYAVMKDSRLAKIVYVSLCFSIFLTIHTRHY